MFKVYETELAGRKLSIETGKIAGRFKVIMAENFQLTRAMKCLAG